ncbi:hypothetical protein DM860_004502 [Cuscuta australis]|uniref:Uncharacterized protein n=1 Tax=Cuscuta australis TaxID=267555 RepID=A0A328EC18_9ASTE|nr:hypothetical protein DM860_004502 [Cuscuta australis]
MLSMVLYIAMNKDVVVIKYSDEHDFGDLLKMLNGFPCLVPLGLNFILLIAYTIVLLLMGNHLFVWIVFSPKKYCWPVQNFEIDCLRSDLNVIQFGLIGWVAPSSIPAINGRSLIELFFHSIGTELAHRPNSHFRLLLPMDDKIIGGATSSDNPKLNQQRIQARTVSVSAICEWMVTASAPLPVKSQAIADYGEYAIAIGEWRFGIGVLERWRIFEKVEE